MLLPVDYELLSTIIFNSDHKENYTKPYTQKVNHEKILKMLKQSTERQENSSSSKLSQQVKSLNRYCACVPYSGVLSAAALPLSCACLAQSEMCVSIMNLSIYSF